MVAAISSQLKGGYSNRMGYKLYEGKAVFDLLKYHNTAQEIEKHKLNDWYC